MTITLNPSDAFAALTKRVAGDAPVSATFKAGPAGRLSSPSLIMRIDVDGQCQDFDIVLEPDGTWASRLHRDI